LLKDNNSNNRNNNNNNKKNNNKEKHSKKKQSQKRGEEDDGSMCMMLKAGRYQTETNKQHRRESDVLIRREGMYEYFIAAPPLHTEKQKTIKIKKLSFCKNITLLYSICNIFLSIRNFL